jgi:hypothetical protein
MVTKYPGYNIKGPEYASIFAEKGYDQFLVGYGLFDDLRTSGNWT